MINEIVYFSAAASIPSSFPKLLIIFHDHPGQDEAAGGNERPGTTRERGQRKDSLTLCVSNHLSAGISSSSGAAFK